MAYGGRALACNALVIAASACSGSETESTPVESVPGCGPESVEVADGSCVVPGVPPERCATGFEPDPDAPACRAILPSEPCAPGTMAIPGELTCRVVAPCGTAPWGDIPIDATTRFVDAAYTGTDGDGSEARPFPTLEQAFATAQPGTLIALATGSYQAYFDFSYKHVRIWGRCPELVEIVGPDPAFASVIIVGAAAGGTELHTLAVRGEGEGILVGGAAGVVVDRLWVHDTGLSAVDAFNYQGAAEVLVKGSLVEQSHRQGVYADGSRIVLSESVVRDTQPTSSDGSQGYGLLAIAGIDGSAAQLEISRALVERNHTYGVLSGGGDVVVEGTLVRDTRLHATIQHEGYGVGVQVDPMTQRPGTLILRSSNIEGCIEAGATASSGDLTIEWSRIRDTVQGPDGRFGRALTVQPLPGNSSVPTNVAVRESTFDHNAELGVLAIDSVVTLDRVAILDTRPNDAGFGDGVAVNPHDNWELTRVSISASRIARSARAGVSSFSGHLQLAGTLLECNLIQLQGQAGDGEPYVFEDLGGNRCECGAETETCHVVAAELTPPQAK